jgi:hypothetical protein
MDKNFNHQVSLRKDIFVSFYRDCCSLANLTTVIFWPKQSNVSGQLPMHPRSSIVVHCKQGLKWERTAPRTTMLYSSSYVHLILVTQRYLA